ncbi:MAG: dihydrodipicolinate synthase family protein [Desulfobacteraceae bacterium]
MAALMLPRGLIVELLTPLDAGGDVDLRGLASQLERVQGYAQSVFLCGPRAGRGLALSGSRRADILEAAFSLADEEMTLMAWITGRSPEETAENLALMEARTGKNGRRGSVVWVDTPLFYHSNRGLPSYYRDLCSSTGMPLILVNDPGLAKESGRALKRSHIRTAVLKELAHMEEVQGLIFTGPLERCRNYRKASRFRTVFRIYDGDEEQFLDHPSSHGVVSPGANLAPAAWREITAYSLNNGADGEGRSPRLRRIWDLGGYLHRLLLLYRSSPGPLIQAALVETGVLGAAGPPGESPGPEVVSGLLSLMRERGDA